MLDFTLGWPRALLALEVEGGPQGSGLPANVHHCNVVLALKPEEVSQRYRGQPWKRRHLVVHKGDA